MNDFSQGKGAKAAPNWKVLALGTLTVPLDMANWSDKVGRVPRPASDVPTDFADAVATVGAVGVSFGGGCISFAFAGGVAPTDGTASFVLKSYSVS